MGRSRVVGFAMAILAGSVQASEPWDSTARPKLAAASVVRSVVSASAAPVDRFNASCGYSEAAFCYDAPGKRVVYRSGRRYMPTFQGLTAEGISVRHDRIILRYTFR